MLVLALAVLLSGPVQGWYLNFHEYGTQRWSWRGPYVSEEACRKAGYKLPAGYGWSCEWEAR